jgi:hypothetical protein
VNVRALLQAGREFGDLTEARDAMPVGVGLPLALAVFPGPLGGERQDRERGVVRLYTPALVNPAFLLLTRG